MRLRQTRRCHGIKTMHGLARLSALVLIWLEIPGCGGGGGGGGSFGPVNYSIGGSVSGLASGTSLVLNDNGQDSITLGANSTFTFQTPLESGSKYSVTVVTQPQGQLCTVSDPTGTVATGNINNILVTCGSGFAIGGTVFGLAAGGTVVLLNNGGDPLSVSSNSSFKFPTPLPWNTIYLVSVGTQPSGQTCTANYAKGDAITDVTNVIVQCTKEVVLWNFGSGADGTYPSGPVIQGGDGNLYGVTASGGTNGRGSVFKLSLN